MIGVFSGDQTCLFLGTLPAALSSSCISGDAGMQNVFGASGEPVYVGHYVKIHASYRHVSQVYDKRVVFA